MGPNNLPNLKQQRLGSYSPLPAPKRPCFSQPSPFGPCDGLLAGSLNPHAQSFAPRITRVAPLAPFGPNSHGIPQLLALDPTAQSFAPRITHVAPLASFGPNSHGIPRLLSAKACPLAAVGPVLGDHSAKVFASPSTTPSALVQDLPTLRSALLAQPPPLSVKACPQVAAGPILVAHPTKVFASPSTTPWFEQDCPTLRSSVLAQPPLWLVKACPQAAAGPVLVAHPTKVFASSPATSPKLEQDHPTLRSSALAQPPATSNYQVTLDILGKLAIAAALKLESGLSFAEVCIRHRGPLCLPSTPILSHNAGPLLSALRNDGAVANLSTRPWSTAQLNEAAE
jgi:hypothetical protein